MIRVSPETRQVENQYSRGSLRMSYLSSCVRVSSVAALLGRTSVSASSLSTKTPAEHTHTHTHTYFFLNYCETTESCYSMYPSIMVKYKGILDWCSVAITLTKHQVILNPKGNQKLLKLIVYWLYPPHAPVPPPQPGNLQPEETESGRMSNNLIFSWW